ncbi:hypothetical protein L1887_23453 [Cichorium endivia]|nr:hypothetical protein L1887_23453 [Cichorium endivia]
MLPQAETKANDDVVQKIANETGLDFGDQIISLDNKYQALKDLYTHLTPIQCVNIARHPNRPTFLDHVFNITEKVQHSMPSEIKTFQQNRKALYMMYYADHHGFPIVPFIDTPGAFADLKSKELGQA